MARVWAELPFGGGGDGDNIEDVVRAWYESDATTTNLRVSGGGGGGGDAGSTCPFEQAKFVQVRPGSAVYDFGERLALWDPYATALFVFFALRDDGVRSVLLYGAITFERVLALGGVVSLERDLAHSRTCVPLDWLVDATQPSRPPPAVQWWLPVYALTRRDPAALTCPTEVLEARIAWLLGERDEPAVTDNPEHEYVSNLLVPGIAHLLEYMYSVPDNMTMDMTAHHVRFMANRLAMEEQRFYDLFEAYGADEAAALRLLANDGAHLGERAIRSLYTAHARARARA